MILRARPRLTPLPLIVLVALQGAAQEPATFYTPVVKVRTGSFFEPNGDEIETWWVSSLVGYNNGTREATTTYLAAYGNGASLRHDYGCPGSWTYPPGVGFVFEDREGGCVEDPVGGPGFLAFTATPGMIYDSFVERIWWNLSCDELSRVGSAEGRRSLPVYRGHFPAGSAATSGPVGLGAPHLYCFEAAHRYLRRINVTLFNAGERSATFGVLVRRLDLNPAILSEQTFLLSAKEVRQINGFDIPSLPLFGSTIGWDQMVWISITADQPFLSYVTTVYDLGTPHGVGFEVYPSRLTQ